MRRFAFTLLALFVSVAACTPAPAMVGDDDDDTPDAAPPPPGTLDVSGDVSADATWEGSVRLAGQTTILPGVTITVAPGTSIIAENEVALTVGGTLLVEGTDAEGVSFAAAPGVSRWQGIIAASGGAVTLGFVDLSGALIGLDCELGAATCVMSDSHLHGNSYAARTAAPSTISKSLLEGDGMVIINGGADLTFVDSITLGTSGDLLVQHGGRLTVEYSQIGSAETGEHCGLHINASQSLVVRNSEVSANVYGFMLGGTSGGVITHNNFRGNTAEDIDDMGGTSGIDATDNYWSGGAPALGPAYDTSGPAAAPHTDVGPRM
jgi:hypothetical protein